MHCCLDSAVNELMPLADLYFLGVQGEESFLETENLMFMIPGLEGCAAVLEPLCRRLKTKVCVLQLGLEFRNETSEDMINRLHQVITKEDSVKEYSADDGWLLIKIEPEIRLRTQVKSKRQGAGQTTYKISAVSQGARQ